MLNIELISSPASHPNPIKLISVTKFLAIPSHVHPCRLQTQFPTRVKSTKPSQSPSTSEADTIPFTSFTSANEKSFPCKIFSPFSIFCELSAIKFISSNKPHNGGLGSIKNPRESDRLDYTKREWNDERNHIKKLLTHSKAHCQKIWHELESRWRWNGV